MSISVAGLAALAGVSGLADIGNTVLSTGLNAYVNKINREDTQAFNAEQAAISRDWQEYMRDTQVDSLRKQGINASMYYGGGGGLSATPSGTAASAGGTGYAPAKAQSAAFQSFLNGYMKSINDGAAIGAQAAMSSQEMSTRLKIAEMNNNSRTLTFDKYGNLVGEQIHSTYK